MKTHHLFTPCGLLLLAVCVLIRYQIAKRRFNRRGIGGVQHFANYGRSVLITFLEKLALLSANACAAAGLLLLALGALDHLKL